MALPAQLKFYRVKKQALIRSNISIEYENGKAKTIKNTIKTGIGFGSALAIVISYNMWQSIGWAIVHGVLGWVYVAYYVFNMAGANLKCCAKMHRFFKCTKFNKI